MSMMKRYAKQILAADLSARRGIPIEAADDIVDHVQDEINEFLLGVDSYYDSIKDIFDSYGIPYFLDWVFDVDLENMNKL